MSRQPFFKLFFSDLVGDTLHLTDAEMGSYILLLGAMWNAGGPLPNDPKRLCRMARCSPRSWPARWEVIGPYFEVGPDGISNPRLMKERTKVTLEADLKRKIGARGNEAKRLKRLKAANAGANAHANAAIARVDSLPLTGERESTPQPSGRQRDEVALPPGCAEQAKAEPEPKDVALLAWAEQFTGGRFALKTG